LWRIICAIGRHYEEKGGETGKAKGWKELHGLSGRKWTRNEEEEKEEMRKRDVDGGSRRGGILRVVR